MSKGTDQFPTVARFSTRQSSEPGKTDLFIGIVFKNAAHLLKPDTVYEIKDMSLMGGEELFIVEAGPIGNAIAWSRDVNSIVRDHDKRIFCTKDELERDA